MLDYESIAKEVLEIEANTIKEAKKDLSFIKNAVELILKLKGKLIITGVGKSGLIGSKIAATLASTGTSSFFLHPTEAIHGDLGMIGKDDGVLAISYSGESEELIKVLPHLKRFNIPIIAMAKTKSSTLGALSDVFIPLNVSKEACPINAAPTSSTTLTLALGDALAICLMRARNFKKEDFASFHPGGSLGKRLFIKVKDLARNDMPIINQNAKLKEAILAISEGKVGNVLLTDDNNKLVGILSDGDLRRALKDEKFNIESLAITYATTNPISITNSNMLAYDALLLIKKYKIQLLIIVDKTNKPIGMLHIHDLISQGIN